MSEKTKQHADFKFPEGYDAGSEPLSAFEDIPDLTDLEEADSILEKSQQRVARIVTPSLTFTGIVRDLTAEELAVSTAELLDRTPEETEALMRLGVEAYDQALDSVPESERVERNLKYAINVCIVGSVKPELTKERLDKWADTADGRMIIDSLATEILKGDSDTVSGLFPELDDSAKE